MKKILRLLAIFIFLFSSCSYEVYAQKKSRQMKKADEALDLEKYWDAVEFYKKAYKKTKNRAIKAEIIFKQAECYRMAGKMKQAENYYKRAIKAKYPDVTVYLRYADALRVMGNLDEAVIQYNKYIELNPNDVRGEMGLKSCAFAKKWRDVPTRYQVELMPVVNSRFSDFSPAFGNGEYSELYFTSSRSGGLTDKIDGRTGEAYSDVWFSKVNKKGFWSRPVAVTEPINTLGNEGPLYVNKRGTVIYLTQCKVEKKKDLGCGIYVSQRKGKLWGPTQLLQIKVDSNTTIGHPTLSADENILIFSSDLSSGYGGKDLWITVKEKRNTWSEPINLGPLVNTPGDEMFPFLADDGMLYFASNGHVGMGGLDIYKTSKDENGAYILPVNLKAPVNSCADDFGMIVEKDGERGYLTSNREGGKGGDDIYQFALSALKLSIQGIVTDSKTGTIMTDVEVKLIGSDGNTSVAKTDNTGKYLFKLDPLKSYEVVVNTEGYLTKMARETTQGIEFDKTFIVDLPLDRKKKEVILPLLQFEFNSFDLSQQSILALDKLAEGLLDHPNVSIAIDGHTDDVGSDKKNSKLSAQRAEACKEYLVSKGVVNSFTISAYSENQPFIIEKQDGRFKVGDVLTASYIQKIRFKKNKEKARQYNRRVSFSILEKKDDSGEQK